MVPHGGKDEGEEQMAQPAQVERVGLREIPRVLPCDALDRSPETIRQSQQVAAHDLGLLLPRHYVALPVP